MDDVSTTHHRGIPLVRAVSVKTTLSHGGLLFNDHVVVFRRPQPSVDSGHRLIRKRIRAAAPKRSWRQRTPHPRRYTDELAASRAEQRCCADSKSGVRERQPTPLQTGDPLIRAPSLFAECGWGACLLVEGLSFPNQCCNLTDVRHRRRPWRSPPLSRAQAARSSKLLSRQPRQEHPPLPDRSASILAQAGESSKQCGGGRRQQSHHGGEHAAARPFRGAKGHRNLPLAQQEPAAAFDLTPRTAAQNDRSRGSTDFTTAERPPSTTPCARCLSAVRAPA